MHVKIILKMINVDNGIWYKMTTSSRKKLSNEEANRPTLRGTMNLFENEMNDTSHCFRKTRTCNLKPINFRGLHEPLEVQLLF